MSTPSEVIVLPCTLAYFELNMRIVLHYAGCVRLKMVCVMLMHLEWLLWYLASSG